VRAQASMQAIKEQRLGTYLGMDPADRQGVQAGCDTAWGLPRVPGDQVRRSRVWQPPADQFL